MTDEEQDESAMLAEMLLAESVLFIGDHDSGPFFENDNPSKRSLAVFVNCNDLFAWACADAEPLPASEIGRLHAMWKADPKYGADRWSCLRRKLGPQAPVERRWREHGTWDAEMDALPKPPKS